MIGWLLPHQARYHPLAFHSAERRFLTPDVHWQPNETGGDECEFERGLSWLDTLWPLLTHLAQGELSEALHLLKADLEGRRDPREALRRLAHLEHWEEIAVWFTDPLEALLRWREVPVLASPPEELLDLVFEEAVHWPVTEEGLRSADRFRDDWKAGLDDLELLCRTQQVTYSRNVAALCQEQPSALPLVGSLFWGHELPAECALALVHLLEDQFRFDWDRRVQLGSPLELEEGVLESFEALEDYCQEPSGDLLRKVEGAWAAWLTKVRLLEPPNPDAPGHLEVRRAKGKLPWVCPLCLEHNLPGGDRCVRCFLGVL